MQNLLTNEFIRHYQLPSFTLTDWALETNEKYFEIEDTETGEIVLHSESKKGMAKFNNINAMNLTILNYDKFITSIPSEPFKHGRKRCDLILYSKSDRYFILGELKDRIPKTKVRSGAKKTIIIFTTNNKSSPRNRFINKPKNHKTLLLF